VRPSASFAQSKQPRIFLGNPAFCISFTHGEERSPGFAIYPNPKRPIGEFYRQLTGEQRLDILLQLSKQEPERRLERVYRIIKLPRR
jgi:hypothetical protein